MGLPNVDAKSSDVACVACDEQTGHRIHTVPEMMFGTGERFDYLECRSCGSLQLVSVPDDIAAYYPDGYYSFKPSKLQRAKDLTVVSVDRVRRNLPTQLGSGRDLSWMDFAGVGRTDRIVDVGCGSGRYLRRLEQHGYTDLLGADPFIGDDFILAGGTKVQKTSLDGLDGMFDLIMFNHSFEHTIDPLAVAKAAVERLAPGGRVLLRVPVVATAWTEFGVHWIQIDPPRHLHLQSVEGMHRLARRAGLRVTRTEFDSSAFQFWGSIQAQRGVAMTAPDSYTQTRFSRRPAFSRREIASFATKAKGLNRRSTGDQAGFLLELDQ